MAVPVEKATALLPPAPESPVDARGEPRFGAWLGNMKTSRWEGLQGRHARGRIWRMLHAKRWHYVAIAGPEVALACVVVDVGWAASAFAYVFDRNERRLLCDHSFMGVQGLTHRVAFEAGEGSRTVFRGLGARIRIERPRGSPIWHVQAAGPGGFVLDASLDAAAAAPTLCAVAPIEGGVANATHKTVCLPVRGEAQVSGRRFPLDGCSASMDHTSGLLARETSWRWASASSARIGLNLVEGFNGPVENAVWIDGQVHPAGEATFEYDEKDALKPWRIRTRNGMVDLTFAPEGARREDKDLVVAQSWYVQPIGTFSGTIQGVEVKDLVGVTEDHEARW